MKQTLSQSLKHLDIWIIVALLIIISALALFTQYYIDISSEQVSGYFPSIAEAMVREDWQQARSLFADCRKDWDRVHKVWPLLINHNDMHDVELSFVDMEILLQQENGPRAARELANLGYYLEHVPQNESFTWQNIL